MRARAITTSLATGLFIVGAAWAGIGLAPVGSGHAAPRLPAARGASSAKALGRTAAVQAAGSSHTLPAQVPAIKNAKITLNLPGLLPGGGFLVGSDATSLAPAPTLFGGTTWQTEGCTELDDNHIDRSHPLPGDGHGWPLASKDCIYLGAFGIGPARAAHTIDDGGVWVRSIAISNGESTIVWQIIDAPGYLYAYQSSVCADCGIYNLRQKISADTGVPADAISIGATHTHAGPDGYGGWGGLPVWYWHQIRDSVIASAKQALQQLEPASITVGGVVLRDFNHERRDTYFSTVDYQATWLQATAQSGGVIATLANFAAHPTIVGDPVLHADWPGAASRRFESLYGGVGLLFNGGLGNVSVNGRGGADADQSAENTGVAFGNAIAADIADGGTALNTNEVKVAMTVISHPVTNLTLAAGGIAGVFSRDFLPTGPGGDIPGAYHWSKSSLPEPGYTRGCDTASPVQVKTIAGGYRIGNALILVAPGEIFSNIAEVLKSHSSRSAMTFVFGQTNDSLGYIPQSFEYDLLGNVVTEYVTMTGEYEEVFAIDRCFGDHVLQTLLDASGALGF